MPTGTMPASPIIINAEEEEEDGFDDQHQVSFDGHRKETMRLVLSEKSRMNKFSK